MPKGSDHLKLLIETLNAEELYPMEETGFGEVVVDDAVSLGGGDDGNFTRLSLEDTIDTLNVLWWVGELGRNDDCNIAREVLGRCCGLAGADSEVEDVGVDEKSDVTE